MDNILKSFPLALIFRGVFPGGFFVISCVVAQNGWKALPCIGKDILAIWLPVAIFVGVIAYVVHRSVVYPFIECFFDGYVSYNSKRCCSPIGANTIRRALYMWSIGEYEDPKVNFARHLVTWNDYVQLQYTSVLCIIFGAVVGRAVACNGDAKADCWLIALTVAFVVGGLFSHWRLCVVADEFEYKYPRKFRSTTLSE
jgi:hypothetical protein